MKAKMPRKPVESGKYLCIWCDACFEFDSGELQCPMCRNSNRSDLVVIYVEDNPREEALYTKVDWHGG